MPPVEIISDKPVLYPVPDAIERFANLVAAAERENIIDIVSFHGGSVEIEAAIRSRSNT